MTAARTDEIVTAPGHVPGPDAPSGARLARLGVVAAVSSRLFGRLVGIVFIAVLAHRSSDSTVAVYGYLLGTATLVATLTDLGVAGIAGREVAAGRLPADAALAAAIPAQLASIVVACAVTGGLTWLGGPAEITAGQVVLTLAFVALNGLVNLWSELLRGQGRVALEAGVQTTTASLLVVFGLVVVAAHGGATALLAVVAAKEVVGFALCGFALRPHRRGDVVRTRELIRQSVHLAIAGTAVIVLWRQGTVIVGARGSVAALATYVVASRFLDAGVTLGSTVGFGLLPGASQAAADPFAFRRLAKHWYGLAAAAGLLMAVVGVALASPITLTVFGDRWSSAVPTVRVIAVTLPLLLMTYVSWFLLLARDEQRWMAVSSIVAAVVAISVTTVTMHSCDESLSAAIGTAIGAAVLTVLLGARLVQRIGRPEAAGSAGLDAANVSATASSGPPTTEHATHRTDEEGVDGDHQADRDPTITIVSHATVPPRELKDAPR